MSISTQGASGQSHWNVPNTLTWLRILMIPAILALFYLLPYPWADPAACAAFALAGITDSLDGYYARKLGQTSRLGAFLDPVADKLIVAAALVLIVSWWPFQFSTDPAEFANDVEDLPLLGHPARDHTPVGRIRSPVPCPVHVGGRRQVLRDPRPRLLTAPTEPTHVLTFLPCVARGKRHDPVHVPIRGGPRRTDRS